MTADEWQMQKIKAEWLKGTVSSEIAAIVGVDVEEIYRLQESGFLIRRWSGKHPVVMRAENRMALRTIRDAAKAKDGVHQLEVADNAGLISGSERDIASLEMVQGMLDSLTSRIAILSDSGFDVATCAKAMSQVALSLTRVIAMKRRVNGADAAQTMDDHDYLSRVMEAEGRKAAIAGDGANTIEAVLDESP